MPSRICCLLGDSACQCVCVCVCVCVWHMHECCSTDPKRGLQSVNSCRFQSSVDHEDASKVVEFSQSLGAKRAWQHIATQAECVLPP